MTHHNDPDQYDSISVIEDLDPEPEIKPGTGRKRELLLGGLLLAAVIFFAGWQWWHQEYQASRYRAGKEAIDNNNWEAASLYFRDAAGYNDADILAKNSQQMVDQRDSLYKSANDHIDKSEWLQALNDIRSIARIQPSYMDIEVRERLATQKVYEDALGGAVVMREAARPAGLYYRTPTAWVWLEGSDTKSMWMANEQLDHIVFDVKSDAATPTPNPTPNPANYMPDWYKGRKLIAAEVANDKLSFTELPVDAAEYPPTFPASDGLWVVNSDEYRAYGTYLYLFIRNTFWGSSLRYQPYSSAASAQVELTATATFTGGEVIAFVDSDSNRYILAQWNNGHGYGPDSDTVIDLYVGAAGHDERRLVYTHKGGRLESAQLSPNGRYLVVTTQKPLEKSLEMISTELIDLEGTGPPRILKEVVRYGNLNMLQALSAIFVRQGAFAGKLVMVEYGVQGTQVSLIDPALATGGAQAFYTLSTTTIPGEINSFWYLTQQDDKGLAVAAYRTESTAFSSGPVTSTINLLVLPAAGLPETYDIAMRDANWDVPLIEIKDKEIILSPYTIAPDQTEQPASFSIYRVPRSANAGGKQVARQVFSMDKLIDERSAMQTTIHLGRSLIAYTRNGELHARTQDGQVDLVLELGVSVIYENRSFTYYNRVLR